MSTPAREERLRFADALAEAGPDAPTLCEGWTTRDLAAHVVLRDRRPDAAAGILVSKLAGYTERVQRSLADHAWPTLLDHIRSGPPVWSPTRLGPVDRLANTVEFFVHLEDVRRAGPGWTVRDLDDALVADLAAALRRGARLLTRRAPVGIVLQPDDGSEPIVARDATPSVTVHGPVGELVLWTYGRQSHARVTLDGPPDAVAAVTSADLGL